MKTGLGGATNETRKGVANRTLLRTYPESPHLCNDISGIIDKLTHSLMNHDYQARLEPTIRRQSASGYVPCEIMIATLPIDIKSPTTKQMSANEKVEGNCRPGTCGVGRQPQGKKLKAYKKWSCTKGL